MNSFQPITAETTITSGPSGITNKTSGNNDFTGSAPNSGTTRVVSSSGLVSSQNLAMASGTDPLSFLTVQNQNGQVIIQQPFNSSTSGAAIVNGTAIPKSHIVVKQRSVAQAIHQGGVLMNSASTMSSPSTLLTGGLEKAGIKRPLNSSSNNVITKVIITKNPLSGQPQAIPAGPTPQSFTLTPVSTSSSGLMSSNSGFLASGSSVVQPGMSMSKTVTLTSQNILSPSGKTVVATIPGGGGQRVNLSVPYKVPISPTKITMIPVSRSPNKQALNSSSITVLSQALNTLAKAGTYGIKPGSPSKVIIKQGPAPTGTGSAISFKTVPSSSLSQSAQIVRAPQIAISQRPAQGTSNVRPISISSAGNMQGARQIQVPGSRFHYVRLVAPNSQGQSVTVAKPTMMSQVIQAPRPSGPITVTTSHIRPAPNMANQVRITLPVNQNMPLAPKPHVIPMASNGQSLHRVILPATSSSMVPQGSLTTTLAPIQPAPPSISSGSQFPPGTAILSAGNNNIQGLQGFALVPASYVTQLQQQFSKPQMVQAPVQQRIQHQVQQIQQQQQAQRDYVPIASIDPAITQYTVSRNAPQPNGPTLEATGSRPRKPCNCTKSQCLKLYCDCFANGEFCQNCNCTNCANNIDHEEERSKAIKSCLDRNPQAFHPKIGMSITRKGKEVDGNRRHTKGCNCKRSGCLKNYCECYEAKIMCSSHCKCIGCKNFEESPERKTLMHLADAAEVRVLQQTAAKTKLSSQISCLPTRPSVTMASGERLPFALITSDVAEATSACLLAQAEEAERMKMPPVVQERMIIEEFGRCLMQIIDSANRTRAANSIG